MKAIVDRIEDNTVVLELESGETITLDKSLIGNAKEGDAITVEENKIKITQKIDTHSIFEKLRNKSKNVE